MRENWGTKGRLILGLGASGPKGTEPITNLSIYLPMFMQSDTVTTVIIKMPFFWNVNVTLCSLVSDNVTLCTLTGDAVTLCGWIGDTVTLCSFIGDAVILCSLIVRKYCDTAV
jgi:hypothetical protein